MKNLALLVLMMNPPGFAFIDNYGYSRYWLSVPGEEESSYYYQAKAQAFNDGDGSIFHFKDFAGQLVAVREVNVGFSGFSSRELTYFTCDSLSAP